MEIPEKTGEGFGTGKKTYRDGGVGKGTQLRIEGAGADT